MAISLQSALTALTQLKKDLSDVPQATFVAWCKYINNFVYRYLSGVDPERFITSSTFNMIAGTSSYALDADFESMTDFHTGFFYTDGNGTTLETRLPVTGPGSKFEGYYINRGNFIMTPVPTANKVFTKRYIPANTQLSSINEYFTLDGTVSGIEIIPNEYLQYVVDALDVKYGIWDEEPGAESYSDARFVRSLDELCENIRRTPNSYNLTDFSSTF